MVIILGVCTTSRIHVSKDRVSPSSIDAILGTQGQVPSFDIYLRSSNPSTVCKSVPREPIMITTLQPGNGQSNHQVNSTCIQDPLKSQHQNLEAPKGT